MGQVQSYIEASHFRLRADDGGETDATWHFSLDQQAIDPVAPGTRFRMRLAIEEKNGATARKSTFIIIQRVNGGIWLTEAPRPFKLFESPNIPPGENSTTQQITSTGFSGGFMYDLSTTDDTITLDGNNSAEYELCLELDEAEYGASYDKDSVIEVAMAYTDKTLLDNYLVLPAFTAGASTKFSRLYLDGQNMFNFRHNGVDIKEMYYGSLKVLGE